MLEIDASTLPDTLSFRLRNSTESAFFKSLFFACKKDELALVAPPGMLNTILEQQFTAQSVGYAAQFSEASDFVILQDALPVGRFMLNRTEGTLLLVDISIMPSTQKKGVGGKIMRMLIDYAHSQRLTLTLSVAKHNIIAFSLYAKLGFNITSDQDHRITMQYRT